MYQEDSDFVHWLLGGDPFDHSACNSHMIQHDAGDIYRHAYYFRGHADTQSSQIKNDEVIAHTLQEELSHLAQHDAGDIYHRTYYFRGPQSSQIENDEVIAHTLQEEFSHLAVVEASEFSHAGEQQLRAPSEPHDCHSPSTRDYYYSGYEYGQDESNGLVPPSSCSVPSDSEDFSRYLEPTDGYLLDDDEVGKWLNQMIPMPHVPRINGEIPSIDEAMSDHERLLSRLQLYGFVEHKVQGDGNCQFRALSDQLYHTPDYHNYVRQQVVNQLKSHPETYEGYVPMDYADYLRKISRSDEWGDHVTLQAAADWYGVRIFVITSFKDSCYIEILPKFQKSKGVIFLSFWAEVHYNSIYFQGGLPQADVPRKKKWWNFGN